MTSQFALNTISDEGLHGASSEIDSVKANAIKQLYKKYRFADQRNKPER
jgi:hypothetical protein